MPPHNLTEKQQLIEHMLNALETPTKSLTHWEVSFIESISDQYQRTRSLSDRQIEVLDRIYSEKTD